jgi:hypothetical protein
MYLPLTHFTAPLLPLPLPLGSWSVSNRLYEFNAAFNAVATLAHSDASPATNNVVLSAAHCSWLTVVVVLLSASTQTLMSWLVHETSARQLSIAVASFDWDEIMVTVDSSSSSLSSSSSPDVVL